LDGSSGRNGARLAFVFVCCGCTAGGSSGQVSHAKLEKTGRKKLQQNVCISIIFEIFLMVLFLSYYPVDQHFYQMLTAAKKEKLREWNRNLKCKFLKTVDNNRKVDFTERYGFFTFDM